jgi:hypothetical protein
VERVERDLGQLLRASDFLASRSALDARLALVLSDNVIEVLMYERVLLEFAYDDERIRYRSSPKFPVEQRVEVTKYFGKKVGFCSTYLGLISSDYAEILRIAHELRNEAYHTGLLREQIIRPVALTHFRVVCRIAPQLWRGSYRMPRREEATAFLSRFGVPGEMFFPQTYAELCDLLRGRVDDPSPLAKSLSGDLLRLTEDIEDSLHLLAADGRQESLDDVLKRVQFINSAVAVSTFDEFQRAYEQFDPPIKFERILAWKKRAAKLASDENDAHALAKYAQLYDDVEPLAETLAQAVIDYEQCLAL